MLLAIDVGNSTLDFGVFDHQTLIHRWEATTKRERTAHEYSILLSQFLHLANMGAAQIDACIIASVVPPLTPQCVTMSRRYLKIEPLVLGPGVRTKMKIHYDNPAQLGADRVADVVAARNLYGAPAIVIDFGTATVFNVLDENGEFRGGAITAGIEITAKALVNAAAQLSEFELEIPSHVTATNTTQAMQSGTLYGYIGLVKEMVHRLKDEWGQEARVIATGGLVDIIAEHMDIIDVINPNLTLEGLRIIWELNRDQVQQEGR